MADGYSTTFANGQLGVLSGTAPTTYSTVYIQLHVGAPGSAGTANISAGSTTRASATFGTPSGGVTSLTTQPTWTCGGTSLSESITDISVWSAATAGTFLFSGAATKAWQTGDTVQLSSLSVTLPTAS